VYDANTHAMRPLHALPAALAEPGADTRFLG
jgi:hypothetical protein